MYALALGHEELNDHDELRSDPALQTAVGADEPLASASALCRWENRMGQAEAIRLHEALLTTSVHECAPYVLFADSVSAELILPISWSDR